MSLEPEQIDRLGDYFVYFEIYDQFGITFEDYCIRYLIQPTACSIKKLKEEAKLGNLRRKKAATIALVTA